MLRSTCGAFWEPVRDSLLPVVVALLSATVPWVAWRLRTISEDVRRTSAVADETSTVLQQSLEHNESHPVVLDRRKSSTRETTSTSPGDDEGPSS